MKIYVCPQCNSKRNFRSLCRDCTEYDDNGNVITPVRMEKEGHHVHDENCGHLHNDNKIKITLDDYRNRRRPKLSKKQYQKMQDILNEANFTEGTVDEARKILQEKLNEEE